LTEALENSHQKSEKKLNLSLEDFVFKGVSEQTKLVFLYCCFMDPQFIGYEFLGDLFQQEVDDDLQFLKRRGLLVETTDKCIRGLELGGEEDGCFVTHRCLQEEMRQRLKSEIDRHEILTRIGECLLSNNRLITCDRNVTRKRDGRRVDANFRQAKHLIAQLSELELDKNESLLNLFTALNEKLGGFFMFYEVSYAKALECFQQVNKVMTERAEKRGNDFGKTFFKIL
jgi:hypothetical protein